jgi:NADPH:quinone reductase-like Zn-dependent oxidoreductase
MASTSLPATMKAAAWHSTAGGIDKNLQATTTHPLPKNAASLPPNSTLARVSYGALNPVDYKVPELPLLGRLAFSSGVPGMDFAGTVVQSTQPHFQPGARVFGMLAPPVGGSLGEYVVVGSGRQACVAVPEGVELRDAATLGVAGLTAWQTVAPFVVATKPAAGGEYAGAAAGKKVFINGGSGGVGTFQIQIAKILGCHVTVSCSGKNAEFCKSLGADEVIDYRTEDLVATLSRKGTQFDLIADNVFNGAAELYWNCGKYLKPEGTYVTIAGNAALSTVRNFLGCMFLPKFLGGGERTFKFVTCVANEEEFGRLVGWMAEGKLKACIEEEFALEKAGEAYARLKGGRTRGKLIVKVT